MLTKHTVHDIRLATYDSHVFALYLHASVLKTSSPFDTRSVVASHELTTKDFNPRIYMQPKLCQVKLIGFVCMAILKVIPV